MTVQREIERNTMSIKKGARNRVWPDLAKPPEQTTETLHIENISFVPKGCKLPYDLLARSIEEFGAF